MKPFLKSRRGFATAEALVLCVILVVGACVGLWLIDVVGVPRQSSIVKVVGTQHVAGYTTVSFIHSGDVDVPITTVYPEEWYLECVLNHTTFTVPCEPKLYFSVTNGQRVVVSYCIGRNSHAVQLPRLVSESTDLEDGSNQPQYH